MDASPIPPTDETEIQKCLAMFSADLSVRYHDEQTIPTRDAGVQRFLAMRHDDSHCIICVRAHLEELASADIRMQQSMMEKMMRVSHPFLCPIIDHQLAPHGHYLVSSIRGCVAVHEFLRRYRYMSFTHTCEFIILLAEALEVAVEAHWPHCATDAHSLFITECTVEAMLKGASLSAPHLPGPELKCAVDAPTIARSAYVPDLALLACDLLGSSARAQRFKPIAHVSAATNQLLRYVLEGQWQDGIEDSRAFAVALRNTGIGESGKPAPFTMIPTATFTGHLPVYKAETHARLASQHAQVPAQRAPECKLPPLPAQLKLDPVASRLRFTQIRRTEQASVTVCLSQQITVGRAGFCDNVAQFFPRNPRNEARTRMISREHLQLQLHEGKPWLADIKDVNPTFIGGLPLVGKVKLGSFTRVCVAGEYDLEIRHLPSSWADALLWQGQETELDPTGAMLLNPTHNISTHSNKTLWLFTDAAFGINATGDVELQPASVRDVLGWFVRDGQTLYAVAAESDGAVRLNQEILQAMQPRALKPNDLLRVGSLDLTLAAVPDTR